MFSGGELLDSKLYITWEPAYTPFFQFDRQEGIIRYDENERYCVAKGSCKHLGEKESRNGGVTEIKTLYATKDGQYPIPRVRFTVHENSDPVVVLDKNSLPPTIRLHVMYLCKESYDLLKYFVKQLQVPYELTKPLTITKNTGIVGLPAVEAFQDYAKHYSEIKRIEKDCKEKGLDVTISNRYYPSQEDIATLRVEKVYVGHLTFLVDKNTPLSHQLMSVILKTYPAWYEEQRPK